MENIVTWGCFLAAGLLTLGCTRQRQAKPVIILAAFGTSVPQAQKALENIDTAVCKAYPNHEVHWALTAHFIINKLQKSGQSTMFARKVPIQDLEAVYGSLATRGLKCATVQSLHVCPGQEFNQVLSTPTHGLQVQYGQPLLADAEAIEVFHKAMAPSFGDKHTATVLCGHGNDHHPEYNKELILLDQMVRKNYSNVYVATVEGQPGTARPFSDIRKAKTKKVKFVPIMVVAGDHVMNDVMGDEPESWKKQLNLPATASSGMGYNPAIVTIFLDHLRQAMRR